MWEQTQQSVFIAVHVPTGDSLALSQAALLPPLVFPLCGLEWIPAGNGAAVQAMGTGSLMWTAASTGYGSSRRSRRPLWSERLTGSLTPHSPSTLSGGWQKDA